MLSVDVPVMNSNITSKNREKLLKQIKEAKASRIWVAIDRYMLFSNRSEDLKILNENIRFFEQNGFEVGVWMSSFGYGATLPVEDCYFSNDKCSWTRIRSVTGRCEEVDALCPEDEEFLSAYLSWVKDIAELRPAMIMLDDDLCLSVRPGIGCFCEKHQKLLFDEVGEIKNYTDIFVGGKNKYRDAWYKVMGNTLRRFCKKVRDAVDTVDDTIRVGFCAGYTSWDIEGVDAIELSRILAGKTEPFYRLTGAPYWIAPKINRFPGQRLSAIIENVRNQVSWNKGESVEYFAEADSYPRPCYRTPAMYVENFDIAMRAVGVRSLKYLFDYSASPEYETKYLGIHTRNFKLYDTIERAFENTRPCGVRLYRPMHRITDAVLPESFAGEEEIMRTYFSDAAAMLSCHAVPTVYDGESDFAAVFGDDALYFEDNHQKTVLDLTAALMLKEKKGVDTGISDIKDASAPTFEIFGEERVFLGYHGNVGFKGLALKEGAKVLSRYDTGDVASFTYGNFLVLNFDAFTVNEDSALYCSYERGKQLQAFYGYPYPAILNNCELYSVCAEREGEHIVLFQNHSIDPVFDFDIILPRKCRSFELYGAEGEKHGDRIRVKTDFSPQSVMLLSVKYEN